MNCKTFSLSIILFYSAANGDPQEQQVQATRQVRHPDRHTLQRPQRYVFWHIQRAQERREQIEASHQLPISNAEISMIPPLMLCEHNPHKDLDR